MLKQFYTSVEMRVLITATDEGEARRLLSYAVGEGMVKASRQIEFKGMDIIAITEED